MVDYAPSVTTEQLTLIDVTWTESSVTRANTVGTVGMVGDETADTYFFYMKFVPFVDIELIDNGGFALWFQMGDTTSEWTGVSFTKDGSTWDGDYNMDPISSSNSSLNTGTTSDYANNSDFMGVVITGDAIWYTEVWRYTTKEEQDYEDSNGDEAVIRIENGRLLRAIYKSGAVSTPFELELTGGVLAFSTPMLALGSLIAMLAF